MRLIGHVALLRHEPIEYGWAVTTLPAWGPPLSGVWPGRLQSRRHCSPGASSLSFCPTGSSASTTPSGPASSCPL